MTANIIALLISSGLASSTARLVTLLIEGFIADYQAQRTDASLLSVAARIVDGINRGHSEWDYETRSRCAADAIFQYALTCGILPAEKLDIIVSMTDAVNQPETKGGKVG